MKHDVDGLTALENSVLKKLLTGKNPVLAILREQFASCRLASREITGVGFHCDLEISGDVPRVPERFGDFHLSDVLARIDTIEIDVGFVLFVKQGGLILLEGHSYGEDWPLPNQFGYSLWYEVEPREISFLA